MDDISLHGWDDGKIYYAELLKIEELVIRPAFLKLRAQRHIRYRGIQERVPIGFPRIVVAHHENPQVRPQTAAHAAVNVLGQGDVFKFVLFVPRVADVGKNRAVDVPQGELQGPCDRKFLYKRETEFRVEDRVIRADQIEVIPSPEGHDDLRIEKIVYVVSVPFLVRREEKPVFIAP